MDERGPQDAPDFSLRPGPDGVQALIRDGDEARNLENWRDALACYQQALWALGRGGRQKSGHRLALYLRIGDLQLEAAFEPEIARGYYEAALTLSPNAEDRVRLLCRLAETYRRSPRALQYLEEAARFAAGTHDDAMRAWTAFRHAEESGHVSHAQRCRILELGKAVLAQEDMPEDWRELARWRVLAHAGELMDEHIIEEQARELVQRDTPTWVAARHHYAVADGLRRVGRLSEAIFHAERAATIYQSLGRMDEEANVRVALAGFRLSCNDVTGARRDSLWVVNSDASDEAKRQALLVLCETWIHDHAADGPAWSRAVVERTLEYVTTSDHAARLGLHDVGSAERVLRATGERMSELYQASALPWLGETVAAPCPVPAAVLRTWRVDPGSETGSVSFRGTDVLLDASPHKGFVRLDVPRLMAQADTDFVLQARIHGGHLVLQDTLACRRASSNKEPPPTAHGAGGLLVVKDLQHALRLAAHVREPGEILAEIREGRERRTLGRVWAGDGVVSLRIERTGDVFQMMAGGKDGWQAMPPVSLSGWDNLEVGVFGECPTDMYSNVKTSTTRFANVALQGVRQGTRPSAAGIIPLAQRPTSAISSEAGVLSLSEKMIRVMDHTRRVAPQFSPVLICGETGTGKELVARSIHATGPREGHPFIALNCAAVARDLLERELFGHVRGAYTGAHEAQGGLFEAANGGTLFLDEIGEASHDLQLRLLRVVEEQAVRPVGSLRMHPIDVRIVSATNENLDQAIRDGRFRADLYYRLRGSMIRIPPLRDRPEDIPLLAYHALDLWGQHQTEPHPGISQEAMHLLAAYPWPGNVRELIHEIHEAASVSPDAPLRACHLTIRTTTPLSPSRTHQDNGNNLQELTEALRRADGNVSEAARELGISRSTIYRRMRTVGLR